MPHVFFMVDLTGFEPSESMTHDLQSCPLPNTVYRPIYNLHSNQKPMPLSVSVFPWLVPSLLLMKQFKQNLPILFQLCSLDKGNK